MEFLLALQSWREAEAQAHRLDWRLAVALSTGDHAQAETLALDLRDQRAFAQEMLRTALVVCAQAGRRANESANECADECVDGQQQGTSNDAASAASRA